MRIFRICNKSILSGGEKPIVRLEIGSQQGRRGVGQRGAAGERHGDFQLIAQQAQHCLMRYCSNTTLVYFLRTMPPSMHDH